MIDYSATVAGLYGWLAKHQIKQKQIEARIVGDTMEFSLDLPVVGVSLVRMKMPSEEYFRAEGIGLRFSKRENDRALLDVYDYGGIYDPVDKCVQGEHYSASHFALMASMMYAESSRDSYHEDALRALEFHIGTYKDAYKFATWNFHFDFNNYAFAEIVNLLWDKADPKDQARWCAYLNDWRNSRNRSSNWAAMRAAAYYLRHKITGSFSDQALHRSNLAWVYTFQLGDGCFDDHHGKSRPIQYHAYVAALIGRLYELHPTKYRKHSFIKAARYLANYVDPEGNFNYKGRGQGQIFGYGVAMYVFELARKLDSENSGIYSDCLKKVWSYLSSFRQDDGHFPLVLCNHPDEEGFGWYDYHHTTVYNAFLGVWLMKAALIASQGIEQNKKEQDAIVFMKESRVVRYMGTDYYGVISGGETMYPSDAGVSFDHLWIRGVGTVFTCPGGPTPESYGARRYSPEMDLNYSVPLIKVAGKWQSPAHKKASIERVSEREFILKLPYKGCILERSVEFQDRLIKICDTLTFTDDIVTEELRLINLPIQCECFAIECRGQQIALIGPERSGNRQTATISVDSPGDNLFEEREIVHTPAGLARVVVMPFVENSFHKGQKITTEWHVEIG